MIYDDVVYWRVEIDDPIALEIITSPRMQRLKWVDQAWYLEPYFPWAWHSRFEHSVWVYLLLKRYWAPIEEQIAWLLHDISHWAFSHCLDYVFDEWNQKEQTHQDNIFEEFLKDTDIPWILEKYWLNLEHILDDDRHPLKENNLPDICADRIDYSLRDAIDYDKLSKEKINNILDGLKVLDNNRVFDNFESAKQYFDLFFRMNEIYWSGIETALMFTTVWHILRYSWKKWYIERNDFYTTDREVIDKMTKYLSVDDELKILRDRMNNKIPFEIDETNYDGNVFCKSRVVDPFFMIEWKKNRVSDVNESSKNLILNNKAKEYFIRFEK